MSVPNLSPTERLLLIVTGAFVAYRFAYGEWPVGLTVEATPEDT